MAFYWELKIIIKFSKSEQKIFFETFDLLLFLNVFCGFSLFKTRKMFFIHFCVCKNKEKSTFLLRFINALKKGRIHREEESILPLSDQFIILRNK